MFPSRYDFLCALYQITCWDVGASSLWELELDQIISDVCDHIDRRVPVINFLSIRDQNSFNSCVESVNSHTIPVVLNLLKPVTL